MIKRTIFLISLLMIISLSLLSSTFAVDDEERPPVTHYGTVKPMATPSPIEQEDKEKKKPLNNQSCCANHWGLNN